MMKKLVTLLTATTLAVTCSAQDATAQNNLTDTSKPILVKSSQKDMVIRLKSNPTTGYSWFLKNYDHNLLTLESHQFIAPDAKLAGAPGIEEWHFKVSDAAAKAPQLSQIILINARPWDLKDAKGTLINWIGGV